RRSYRAVYRGEELFRRIRARGHHLEDFRGHAVLLPAAGPVGGGGGGAGGQWLRQGRAAAAADGIRRRGAEADLDQPRRQRGIKGIPWKCGICTSRSTQEKYSTASNFRSAAAACTR